ncbi:MAG: hypothetical protein ACI9E9_001983 [Reinekea sp.]|jgi:hypothetical protein
MVKFVYNRLKPILFIHTRAMHYRMSKRLGATVFYLLRANALGKYSSF